MLCVSIVVRKTSPIALKPSTSMVRMYKYLYQCCAAFPAGTYGSVPQSIIDSEHDTLRKLHSTSPVELDELHRISTNAQKQYVRSRTQPAPESVKRAKDLVPSVLPAHPMFEQLCSQEDMASSRLLDSLKSYRPNQVTCTNSVQEVALSLVPGLTFLYYFWLGNEAR